MLVLGLVAGWALATNHCRLETVPGFDFLSCLSAENDSHHESSDCETDGCATIESGLYKSENTLVPTIQPPRTSEVPDLNQRCPAWTGRPLQLAFSSLPVSPPLSLARFLLKCAISPRAPSMIC